METSFAIGTHKQKVAYKTIIPKNMWRVLMTWTTIANFQPVTMHQMPNAMQTLLRIAGVHIFHYIFIFLCSSSLSFYHSVKSVDFRDTHIAL